ncbi:MAG: aminotransferase class V-fold PLP-dependent enzyme [Pseudomonadota bacterium]
MKQYLFTPGPVPMSKEILKLGSEQVPYFRNTSFSKILIESKTLLLKLVNAKKGSDVIFLASSGTGAMEAATINLLNNRDKAIVINGGGFGQRFIDICSKHDVPNYEIKIKKNKKIDFSLLKELKANAFVVNAHETSIGKIYNLNKIGEFCKKNKLLNIVDAISAFVCEDINMKKQNIDALILSSNKGLALPPGLAMVVLSPNAIKKLKSINVMYFDFKMYLANMVRGQTPFTPTVSIIKQLHFRLNELNQKSIKKSVQDTKQLAQYFRKKIKAFPLKPYLKNMPNGMTTLTPTDGRLANKIISDFEQQFNIILTPSGGGDKNKLIRISHMGYMTKEYIDVLIDSLKIYYNEEKK